MPGHKGRYTIPKLPIDFYEGKNTPSERKRAEESGALEEVMKYDITEIDGADYLSAPSGIIAESEANAGKLFGCSTFYSAEGSSLCIRAMMFLIKKYAKQKGHEPFVLAGRNAHSSFVNACAVLDIDVEWIMQKERDSYETCSITGEELETMLTLVSKLPDAVYVTSPDYLGNMLNIKELAEVCHKHGIILLVDNAHGAYLKFLKGSLHPMDLGADICCDSAHKTLPVLTGGAYLHIASARSFFVRNARQALSLFATTSPSYLILQSLDLCNDYLENNTTILETADKVKALKEKLTAAGYYLIGNEPLKVTLLGSWAGKMTEYLKSSDIYVEYHDEEHIVLMFSGNTSDEDFRKVENALLSFPSKLKDGQSLKEDNYRPEQEESFCQDKDISSRKKTPIKAMSFMEAMMVPSEMVSVKDSIGRILAQPVLNCPPCVPVYMCGEVIGEDILSYCSRDTKITVVAL